MSTAAPSASASAPTNGEIAPKDGIPSAWLPMADAVKQSGLSIRTLRRFAENGDVTTKRDGKGALWFDPDDLEAAKPQDSKDRIIGEATKLLLQAHAHLEKQAEPTQKVLELLMTRDAKREARISELEGKLGEMHDAAERARNQDHERLLLREKQMAEQRRLDEAFGMLKNLQPLVNAYMAKHFGIPETGEAAALAQFLASFSSDEISSMTAGLPSEKQLIIMGIYAGAVERQAKDKAKAAASSPGITEKTPPASESSAAA